MVARAVVPRARAAKDKVKATEAEGRAAVCQTSQTTPSATKRSGASTSEAGNAVHTKRSGASTSEAGNAVQARFGQQRREQCKSVRAQAFIQCMGKCQLRVGRRTAAA